jgi:hypothetical protein
MDISPAFCQFKARPQLAPEAGTIIAHDIKTAAACRTIERKGGEDCLTAGR